MNIFKFLERKGIDTINSSFYTKVREWESWYRGNVRGHTFYRVYTGKGTSVRRKRKSLQMAKKICEDMADLLLNERVIISVGEPQTNRFVHRILTNNNFYAKANEYQERKAAVGTTAYVASLRNMIVDEDGNVLSGDINIDYFSAKDIFPVSWSNGKVTECAFLYHHTHKRRKYIVCAYHHLETVDGEETYVIDNMVIEARDGSVEGQELTEQQWKELKPFETLAARVTTGSDKPLFVIDRLAIVNNADEDETNPMGISLYANSIDVIRFIDEIYDSYGNEFSLGKRRAFVAPTMLTNIDGSPAFDPDDTVFYKLPDEYSGTAMSGKPFEVMDCAIRESEHEQAINNNLNLLSLKCGFGTERYKFEAGAVKTATEVISVHSDLYQTITKHESILDDVIRELVEIIIRLGITIGEPVVLQDDTIVTDENGAETVERYIKIDFDDSIIEDKDAERREDRSDVSMGAMSLAEYRAKWYGESLEEAEKKVLKDEVMG